MIGVNGFVENLLIAAALILNELMLIAIVLGNVFLLKVIRVEYSLNAHWIRKRGLFRFKSFRCLDD